MREQVRDHLTGPVLTCAGRRLGPGRPGGGLVPGLQRGAGDPRTRGGRGDGARSDWKKMGARSEDEALGIFMHSVRRRWGSVSDVAVVGARVIHGRLPATRRQNGAILRHGPPPSYARGQGAVGGVEPRRCIPASYAGRSARGGGPVSGARRPRVGRYRLSRPHAPAKFAGPQM